MSSVSLIHYTVFCHVFSLKLTDRQASRLLELVAGYPGLSRPSTRNPLSCRILLIFFSKVSKKQGQNWPFLEVYSKLVPCISYTLNLHISTIYTNDISLHNLYQKLTSQGAKNMWIPITNMLLMATSSFAVQRVSCLHSI